MNPDIFAPRAPYTIHGPRRENGTVAVRTAFSKSSSCGYTWDALVEDAIAQGVVREPGIYFVLNSANGNGAFIEVEKIECPQLRVVGS